MDRCENFAVGATGFEPATFRPPAERIRVSMCLGASVVSYLSRAVDDLDAWGTKAVPRRGLTIGHAGQANPPRPTGCTRERQAAHRRKSAALHGKQHSAADTPAGTRQQLDGPVARLWEALPAARSGLAAALAQERVRGAGRRANLGVTSIYLQGIEAVDLELTPSHLEGGLGPEAVLRAHVFSLFPASRRRCGLLAGGSAHEIE